MKCFFLGLFVMLTVIGYSQNRQGGMNDMPAEGQLTGYVYEKESGKPVEFANVVIYSMRDSSIVSGGITDKTGFFNIDKIRYGKFYVEINFIGYGKHLIPEVSIKPDKKVVNLGKIYLSINAEMLNEVNIEASVNQVDYRLDKKVVTVNQDIIAAGGTAVDALANVPSVSTDIDGNVSLRGTESFMVLIDGRPSPIQGSEALQQIPASTIDNIEIITNPSAKYDPDGVGGIINVVLKKEKRKGYNGQVAANYGTFNSFGGNALFNIRTEKLNFFVGGEYSNRKNEGSGVARRETYINTDTSFFLNTISGNYRDMKSGSFRGGLDYYLSEDEVLTVSGRYGLSGHGMGGDSWVTSYYQNSGILYDEYYYLTENVFSSARSYFSGDVNYMKKFKKPEHELQVYGSYSSDFDDEVNQYNEQETDYLKHPINDTISDYRTIETGKGNTITAKADYVLPLFSKAKFETGYQLKYSSLDNNLQYQTLDEAIWVDDTSKINPYLFVTNVQSGYAIFSNFLGDLGYQVGLRTEYTDRIFQQTKTLEEWKYNKFDFFPSVHLSYQLPKEMQIMASYSRRLDRPRNHFLDPFIEIHDPNNISMGNPLLLPEYTNSYELNFQKKFNSNFVSFEAYARQTNNKIEEITMIDPLHPDVFISTYDNIGKDLSIGGELMANLNLTKWWNFNLSGDGFYYEIITADANNNPSNFSWSARLNNTFRLRKTGTSFQLGGFYEGPEISSQGTSTSAYLVNAGLRQDFLDRKLSISINVRDVFGTMNHTEISQTDQFYSYSHRIRKSPTFNLSITYKINDFSSRKEKGAEGENEGGDEGM